MHAILGNSDAVCHNLRSEGVDEDKLGIIYNGVNLEPFKKECRKKEKELDIGIENDDLIFSIVANLIPYKGHIDLLKALSIAKKEIYSKWRLLVIGRDDGIGKYLKEESQKLGIEKNILWLGSRPDVPEILKISDIGILSSHEEGFSNAILEGMAAGLPMVVTDVGGNSEAVINDQTGFVVPARNPEALAAALLKLANDKTLRLQMGALARKRIESEFSLGHCARQYEKLYSGLTKDSQRAVMEILRSTAD
jgi:glycosyltransferase involved in cell wall biosynthesis